jgi:hypothetical protein
VEEHYNHGYPHEGLPRLFFVCCDQ